MGTNYYVPGRPACESCGRPYEDSEIHLGKSSFGWEFTFAWNDGKYYKNIDQFRSWLADKTITNEYDEQVSQEEFWQMVEAKKGGLTLSQYYEQYPQDNPTRRSAGEFEVVIDGWRFMYGDFS